MVVGIIASTWNSSWLSTLAVVIKNNGEIKISSEFRNMNISYEKDNYPLPNMKHILQMVTTSQIMSIFDGFSWYNKFLVRKANKHKKIFTKPWGSYEYLRIPFDLLNARETFQREMDFSFKDIIGKII